MKIAIISDIHANKEALISTMTDIKNRNCDQIICLGDIIGKGKHNNECIKIIRENCDIVLKGNMEEDYASNRNILEIEDDLLKERIEKYKQILSKDERDYLKNLPYCYEFYLSGRLIRLFHAGPDTVNNYKNTFSFASIEKKYEMFKPNALTISKEIADIVIYGHIHEQMMFKLYNRTLISCGSVGNSLNFIRNEKKDANVLNTTNANYVILEGNMNSKEYSDINFEFIQVPYDIYNELKESNIDENSSIYYELMYGIYRNKNKLKEIFNFEGIDIENL